MRLALAILVSTLLGFPAASQQSPDFPHGSRFVIQLTSSQFVSGWGEYLVPPLLAAFRGTGLIYNDGSNADYAASIETGFDVGKWVGEGEAARWLHTRFVTVGLSPADIDIEPQGRLSPSFSVKVVLVTPNPDRVDELNCLITLATRELAARFRAKGHVVVDGSRCARK